jgi:DNA primase
VERQAPDEAALAVGVFDTTLATGCALADDWGALIQQVKNANDVVDVVGSYVTLRPSGPTFKGLCPFHDDHRPSFDVDPRRQRYRCWSCGKHGDVFTFIQEHERVDFREALELLARRAGIPLQKRADSPQRHGRALMLEIVRWSADQYHRCLLDSPLAEGARRYLAERQINHETVRRFGLGFAPAEGDWLSQRSAAAGMSAELLEKLGLLALRQEGRGHYDRFRDRVMFPIRTRSGETVGFGGRILPNSPYAARAPKYYNSCETPFFTKSEHLYGIDQARQAALAAGYVAVVEGYTDVLMAHQMGVAQVVATMGTALNARHVRQLRQLVPRVVLVFDADAGGDTGVDRALEIFVSHDVELAVATLPEGLDPCDLLLQQGADALRAVLAGAVDALEFKLDRLSALAGGSIEDRRRAVDAILNTIARAPEMPGRQGAIKRELIVTRISKRLALKEETIWGRLRELQHTARSTVSKETGPPANARDAAPAPPSAEERELLEVLLAEPSLVPTARAEISSEQVRHPSLRRLLEALYRIHSDGELLSFNILRERLEEPALEALALELQDMGEVNPDRPAWLQQIMAEFRRKHFVNPLQQELKNQLVAASDHGTALDLLRRLQHTN